VLGGRANAQRQRHELLLEVAAAYRSEACLLLRLLEPFLHSPESQWRRGWRLWLGEREAVDEEDRPLQSRVLDRSDQHERPLVDGRCQVEGRYRKIALNPVLARLVQWPRQEVPRCP